MTVKLNAAGYSHAQDLIKSGKVDKSSAWSFDASDEDQLLGDPADYPAYSKNFLGHDTAENTNTKAAWKYPFAKGGKVYRAALIAIRQRAGQQDANGLFDAAGRLLAEIDGDDAKSSGRVQVRALSGDTTEITIYGEIGQTWDGAGMAALDFLQQIQSLKTPKCVVRINSIGGAVDDALAIVNAMKRSPADITCVVDGSAASSASLICMGADRVEMAPNALMMLHAPWGIVGGNAKDMRNMADALDKYALAMAQDYVAKSGQPLATVMGWLGDGADHWFTAQEAVDAGLADSIVEEDAPAEAAEARLDLSRYVARAPARIAAMLKKPIQQQEDPTMTKKTQAQLDSELEAAEQAARTAVEAAAAARIAAGKGSNDDEKVVNLANARIAKRASEFKAALKPYLEVEGVMALYTEALADPSLTLEAVQAKVMEILGKGTSAGNPRGHSPEVVQLEGEKRVQAMAQSLVARSGKDKMDGQNPYRGARLIEIVRASLNAGGANTAGLSDMELAMMALGVRVRGAQTTSDFPVVLENTLHKMILTGFLAAPATWKQWCKTGSVSDFRAWKRIVPGVVGNLDDVNEHGEYLDKEIPDGTANSNQAKRRGNIIRITPEVIINDDLGYISGFATGIGQAGPRAINRKAYALLVSNPALADGIALFHANHGNLAAGADKVAPSVAALDKGRQAMSKQTLPGDDAEYAEITPKIALSETSVEGTMRAILGSTYDPTAGAGQQRTNIVANLCSVQVGSPRLDVGSWYLFGDPELYPVIEVVFLNGQQEPAVFQEPHFDTGGLRYRVELPFGVGAIDFRGAYKNPGS